MKFILLFLLIQDDPVKIELTASHFVVSPGKNYVAVITFSIDKPYHIYSNNKQGDFTETNVKPIASDGIEFGKPIFPDAKFHDYEIGKLELYEDKVYVVVHFSVKNNVTHGQKIRLEFELQYQSCTEQLCMFPKEGVVIKQDLDVGSEELGNIEFSKLKDIVDEMLKTKKNDNIKTTPAQTDVKEDKSSESGTAFPSGLLKSGLLFKYLAGIGVAFTPCVLPLFPITISFFAYQAGRKKLKILLLGLVYVLGLSLTFSFLGVIAGLAGGSFGTIISSPFVLMPLTLILISLGLSMVGLFEVKMPSFIMDRIGAAKSGFLGAFLMGSLFSVIAAPCAGPVILQLLTDIATTRDVYYGGSSLFVFALGISTVLLVVAIFGSSIPKSGVFMYLVKLVLGIVIILYSIY
ncbi:MAG: sulfite exporter TauE/SafE family protein, partial [Planctomycetes bacterium]|nr:sulfite exporter TauE/SafE family protein [Planctomycetota bacterium]